MKNAAWSTFVIATVLSGAALGRPGQVVSEVPAPGRTCTGLTYDGERIWVADHGLDQLLAVDPATGKILKRLTSPGHRPAGLAFDGQQLWNADVLEAKLYRIRPSDGLVTRAIPSPVAAPGALAFDGTALWVADDATRTIHRVEPTDGTTIAELPFPGASATGLAHDGNYLWVADRLADKLYAVHPGSGEVVASLASPGPHPTGLGFDGRHLLSVDYQTDRIAELKTDDDPSVYRENPREDWVVFTHQVRNYGPDPLPSVELYLAIPAQRESQELLSGPVFEPAPKDRPADRWGQPVAHFAFSDLAAGAQASVRMRAHVRAFDVHHVVYPHKVQGLWKIPAEIRRRYLVDEPKYAIDHPVIRAAVAEAVGDEKHPYWIARKIYAHVHRKMHYEMIGGWDVAPKVLERGSGSCSEYSFVYIAMCRAAGLPARYVGALVIRKDDASYDDVFHRWVEIYLPPYGWVPVDPSRGDKASPAARAEAFGNVSNDFLITTAGGGGSDLLGWNYNCNHENTCRGRCKVEVESIAEWSPEDPTGPPPKAPAVGGGISKPPENSGGAQSCGQQ